MKTIVDAFLVLIFCNICFGQTSILTIASYTGPTTFSEDPNLNKDWDWEQGDVIQGGVPRYYIFLQNKPNTGEYAATLPWRQQSSWVGLEDRKKEDGWTLLARDFGTPERRLIGTNPYFVLYNPFRSVIRVFILLKNVPASFTYSTMELKTYLKESGALAHLAPVAYAMDKVQNMYNNATSAAIPSLALSDYWVYGDFPLALDNSLTPTGTTEVPASLIFDVYGTVLTEVRLETVGFGAQGDKKFIQDFMAKNNFGSPGFSLNKGSMPTVDIPFNLPDVNMKATAPDWDSFNNFIKNLKVDMDFGKLSASNPFKGLFDGFNSTLSDLSIALPLSISGLDLGGIVNFFVGGGMNPGNVAQTPPTFISTHYSSTGTLTTKNRFASVTIPLPASRNNYKAPFNGGEVGIIRNEPVGLLTLTKTPKINKRKILIATGDVTFPQLFFVEYEIAENLQYTINQSAGVELKKMEAYLLTEFRQVDDVQNWLTSKINNSNQKYLIQMESPVNSKEMNIRSTPVPEKYFKGRKLHVAQDALPAVKVKIKATFQRKDDANAQPIVFMATYNTDIIDLGGYNQNYVYTTMPTIPPQNIKCAVGSTGVTISWDVNPENNIKYYAIERSINGGTYYQIGTSTTALFVDAEVQKAVKPYQTYRQNVSVNYRIKAKAEWLDESNSMKSQFSAYSDIVNIYGSVNMFSKGDMLQVIPESNSISQNFPNPFNPATTIYYGVKDPGNVTVKIFNALGQEIITLVSETKEVGYHYVEWNAANMPSGVYFYKIQSGNYTESKKMILTK